MLVSDGNYGEIETEYRTERNIFAQVTYKIGNDGVYFEVNSKDGRTLEYGNAPGSKSYLPDITIPFAFYVNKVTDANGNYMTYTYEQNEGEIYIKKIEYTGNSGLSPYNIIDFYYDERPDQRSYYITEAKVTPNRLLRQIVIKTKGKLVQKYTFKYFKDDIDEMCLNEIIVSNKAGEELNSTIINWGDLNSYNITPSQVTIPTYSTVQYKDMDFYSMDVNADGLSDLVSTFHYNSGDGEICRYNTYLANVGSNNNYSFIYSSSLSDDFGSYIENDYHLGTNIGPLFGDLIGCGKNDVIIPKIFTYNTGHAIISFKIPLKDWWYNLYLPCVPLYSMVDFDKDGRDNLIYLETLETNGYYNGAIMEVIGDLGQNLDSIPLKLSLNSKPKNIFVGDYNIDGLVDLRVVTDSKIYTYLNKNGSINDAIAANTTDFSNIHSKYFKQGDFNGDGAPDLLIIGENDENIAVAYGNGTSLTIEYLTTINGIEDPDTHQDDDKDNCIVMDFNNDGLSDFILFEAKYKWDGPNDKDFDKIIAYWYKSTGTGFSLEKQAESNIKDQAYKNFYVRGDFTGDGRQDLMNYGFDCYNQSSTTTLFRYYKSLNLNFEANKVTEIYNGLNQKTEIKYRPLSHAFGLYTKGTSIVNDVVNIQVPMYVVESVTLPDGVGGTNTTNYFYEGLRAHTKGKGLLGFEKIIVENSVSKIKNVNYNTLDGTYFVVDNQTSEAYANGNLISSKFTDYEATTHANNSKCIFNHPVSITNTNKLTHVTITKNNYSYDDYGNILSMKTDYGGDATVTVTNAYNSKGSWCDSKLTSSTVVTKYTEDATSDTKTSTYSYNDKGNMLTNTSSDITVTILEEHYDKFGNILEKKTSAPDNEDRIEKFTYDGTGRFVTTATNVLNQDASYSYNDLGQLVYKTGIDGLTTNYTYDYWGKLKTVTYANEKKSTYSSDWLLNADHLYYELDETDGAPDIKTFYDYLGRKVRTKTKGFEGDVYSDIIYNAKGQVEQTNSPYYESEDYTPANVTTYTYYDDGRKESITSNGLTKWITYDDVENIVTETLPSGKTKVTTHNSLGSIKNIVNNGLSIDYCYFSNGQLKNVSAPGSTIGMTYDDNGFQQTLNDPDAGNYTFDYDAYGQLESKTTPNGNFSTDYDVAGRIETETGYGTVSYTYVKNGNGINQVDSIKDDQGVFMNFDYNKYGQVIKMSERVGDLSLTVNYEYDEFDRTTAINYPGGFGIKYVYHTESGELIEIYTNKDSLIWRLKNVNSHDLIKKYEYGNGLETVIAYTNQDIIQNISTGSGTVQDLTYTFDIDKGRFDDRTGLMSGIKEAFGYDDANHNFNQLETVVSTSKPELNLSIEYSGTIPGQIESKSDVGTFQYKQERNAGPHAISGITNVNPNYAPTDQDTLIYTSFGKVAEIEQGNYRIVFTYGPDQQRKTMEVYQNDVLQRKVYYFGNYERHEHDGDVTELYYIYAASGLTAIYKKDNGETNGTMYYIITITWGRYMR